MTCEPDMKHKLKHLYRQRRADGLWLYRFEMPGRKKRWMKSKPGTDEFLIEHAAYMKGVEPGFDAPAPPAPARKVGTFSWLVRIYQSSAEWDALSDATRSQRNYFYSQLEPKAGGLPAEGMTAADVRRIRDARKSTPGAARNMLKALSALYDWGVEEGHVEKNPVKGVKRPAQSKTGFTPWNLDDLNSFRRHHAAGTREHLAMCLLLFTACRRADVVGLGPQHARGGWMRWTQGKTGDLVEVPILPPLAAAVAAAEPGMVFLRTEYGRPFSVPGFGNWWSKRVKAAGVKAAPAHGLRKAAGALLAEFGCTENEIMSVLGHADPGTARVYTRSANRRLLAESAMRKLESFRW